MSEDAKQMLYGRLQFVQNIITTQMNPETLAIKALAVGIDLDKLTDDDPMSD
jgi:hypothetical protein